MAEGFSGEPLTRWDGPRNMELVEEVTYSDPDGKKWTVPQNAFLNGATIPRALWTWVGAPYAGKYRRASVIHDYFVGEGPNPDVTAEARKEADWMFFHACLSDGCTRPEARRLFIGVRFGSWMALSSGIGGTKPLVDDVDILREPAEFEDMQQKYLRVVEQVEAMGDEANLDAIDELIEKELQQ